jgi:hypothetical protein
MLRNMQQHQIRRGDQDGSNCLVSFPVTMDNQWISSRFFIEVMILIKYQDSTSSSRNNECRHSRSATNSRSRTFCRMWEGFWVNDTCLTQFQERSDLLSPFRTLLRIFLHFIRRNLFHDCHQTNFAMLLSASLKKSSSTLWDTATKL